MLVKASASHLPITPRKVQLVAFAIKHMKPAEAVTVLSYLNKNAASYLMKVIMQAVANAKNNHHLAPESLSFDQIIITKGMTLKRFNAGARGRGNPYQRLRSHVTVILKSRPEDDQPLVGPTPPTPITPIKKSKSKK